MERRHTRRSVCWLALAAYLMQPAIAQRPPARIGDAAGHRVALILGNATYVGARLANPLHDAEDMQTSLRRLGFAVTVGTDLSLDKMNLQIDRFVRSVQPGDIVFFYFSGHGMQIEGDNLLVPVDFSAGRENEAKERAVGFDNVQHRIESSGARLSIMVMDACRNNPYHRFRAFGRGMAPVEAGLGSYIAFAAGPGQTADDNPAEHNGLFTKFLLQSLEHPPPISQLFRNVRDAVWLASGRQQRPYLEDQLIGDFAFSGQMPVAQSAPPISPAQKLMEQGVVLYHQGKCGDALAAFDQAVRIDPENAYAQNSAGMAYTCLKQPSLAVERFAMAITLNPAMAAAFLNRGSAYLASGNYKLAVEDFTWAAEQEPATSLYYVRRGQAYFLGRQYEEALSDFDRAIQLNSSDPIAYYGRGQVRQRLGRDSEALADFDAALERKPDFPDARSHLDAVARRLRNP